MTAYTDFLALKPFKLKMLFNFEKNWLLVTADNVTATF